MSFGIPGINAVEPPTYKLFISHAWDRAEYDSLVELIKPDARFRWEDLSVPKESPIPMLLALPKSIRTFVHELDDRIKQADCVVIITGMYVAHRQWIQSEIEAALEFKKSIVGVAPRGQERIPQAAELALEKAAGELVRWNRESIVSAIRRRAGLEPQAPVLPLSSLLGHPASRPPGPSPLADFLRNPPPSPPSPTPSNLSELFTNIMKNWPKK